MGVCVFQRKPNHSVRYDFIRSIIQSNEQAAARARMGAPTTPRNKLVVIKSRERISERWRNLWSRNTGSFGRKSSARSD